MFGNRYGGDGCRVVPRGGIGMISGAEKIYDSLDGGPGTVYFETKADGEKGGVLVIKGSGSVSTDMRGAGLCSNMCESFSFSHVILTNGGRLAVCKGVDLKVLSYSDADKTAKFNGLSVFGGTLELPAAVTNLKIVSCGEGSVIRPLSGDTLELCSNSLLKANSSLAVESNLTVGANAKITHTSSRKMALHVHGNLEIEEKGVITATGLGYVAKKGPGSVSIDPSSASHGGIGYAEGASCYGDIKTPVEYGSGAYNYHAGAGGGVIRLVVGNTTALDGSIVADAAANKEGQSGSSGGMALSRDLTVRELEMNSSVGKLDLNGFRLRILSTKHKGRRGWLGTVIEDGGSIVWGAAGFGIIVR